MMPQKVDGNGLDLFIATSGAAPALRLVVAAVSSDISATSAIRAAQSTYTQVVSRLTGLPPDELRAVRAYEEASRGRRTILLAIDRLLG